MFNGISLYENAGRKAAKAMNDGDTVRAKFEQQHMHKMLAFESQNDRNVARAAYDQAYRQTRRIR